jgi:hypothetical protein
MRPTSIARVLGPLLLSALASCVAPRSGDVVAVRDEVQRYYEVLSARDWPAYRDLFWPQATLTTVWQPPEATEPGVVVKTIEDFIAHTAEGPDSQPIFEERLLGAEVSVVGDLAVVWTRYEAIFGVPGTLVHWEGVDAFTWMRHGGRWRIVALAYQSDLDGGSPDAP